MAATHTPSVVFSSPTQTQIVRLRAPHGGPQAKSDPVLTPARGRGVFKANLGQTLAALVHKVICTLLATWPRGPSQPHSQDNRAGGWKGKCPHPKQHTLRTRGEFQLWCREKRISGQGRVADPRTDTEHVAPYKATQTGFKASMCHYID